MRIIAIANQKGGVGKTTVTMSLAAVAQEAGSRCLVVDVDPQRSADFWAQQADDQGGLPFDVTTSTDPSELGEMRHLGYDVIFVDTPGSLEATDVLATVLQNADFAILPTEPAPLALAPVVHTVRKIVEPAGLDYRVLLNKVDPRVPGDASDAAGLLDRAGLRRFRAFVRTYKVHTLAPFEGTVVTQYAHDQRTSRAVDDFRKVHAELMTQFANQTAAV